MKTIGLIGKKIVKVEQTKFFNVRTHSMDVAIDYIELENGHRITFVSIETDGNPEVAALHLYPGGAGYSLTGEQP